MRRRTGLPCVARGVEMAAVDVLPVPPADTIFGGVVDRANEKLADFFARGEGESVRDAGQTDR